LRPILFHKNTVSLSKSAVEQKERRFRLRNIAFDMLHGGHQMRPLRGNRVDAWQGKTTVSENASASAEKH
jgi:hypothetical protein